METATVAAKLAACARTRQAASTALHATLKTLLERTIPITERAVRDLWHQNLHADPSLHGDGWYVPPPRGMAVLIGTDVAPQRLTYPSLRAESAWPRDDVELDRARGLLYAYASPVDRATGVIGDFAVTLYFGDDERLHRHLNWALELDRRLFDYAALGMRLGELTATAATWITEMGLRNDVATVSDVGYNIGHTVPCTDRPWTTAEMALLNGPVWADACATISAGRRFLTPSQDTAISPGMAFTIEPRPENDQLPRVSYHTIAMFDEDGGKQWLTGFDDLFTLAGMEMAVRSLGQ